MLKRRNAVTLPELVRVLEDSYTPRPIVEVLEGIFDIKKFLKDYLPTKLQNHSRPHSFKFFLTAEGTVAMNYKHWAVDKEWLPLDDKTGQVEPLVLLEQPLPVDRVPELCPPSWDSKVDLDRVEAALAGNDYRFTKKESEWWDLFVREKRAESAICKADVDAMARTLWPVLLLSQWREPRRTVVKDDEYARREETMAMLVTKRNTFNRVRLP